MLSNLTFTYYYANISSYRSQIDTVFAKFENSIIYNFVFHEERLGPIVELATDLTS